MKNPFVTNGYAGSKYFCDRVKETNDITDMLTNENNVALISPRRIGKTDLICHVFDQEEIKKHYHSFVIDIYSTTSLRDFVNVLGKGVLDDINGNPVWGLGLGAIENPVITLDEIFSYLNGADKPCLVAIDEFQQITKYADAESVEATLRTYIQRCTNVHFIFSGSHRHLMNTMFTSPSRPFYQSVTLINLKPINQDKYLAFATDKFSEANKHLAPQVIGELYTRFEAVTSYMHRVLNVLFMRTKEGETCTVDKVDEAIEYILDMASDSYESLLYQMPEKQRNVFVAIARDGKVTAPTSGSFVHRHRLTSPSSVSSALKGLLDKDFITQNNGIYSVYDQFFVLWMKAKGMGV